MQIQLVGAGNRDAIGARLRLDAGGAVQWREIDGGREFLSVSQRIAHFGLGEVNAIDTLEVIWPDGSSQTYDGEDVPVDSKVVLVQATR